VSLSTPGTDTISVTDLSDVAATGSAQVTALANGSGYTVTAPTNVTQGIPFTVAVTDSSGSNNTFGIQVLDPKGSAPASGAFSNGSATFTATLNTVGSEAITVGSGSSAGTVLVNVFAPAKQFIVTAPSSTQVGVPFTVTVTPGGAGFNSNGTGEVAYPGGNDPFSISLFGSLTGPSSASLVNGVATFTVVPTAAGTGQIFVIENATNVPGSLGFATTTAYAGPDPLYSVVASAPYFATQGVPFTLNIGTLPTGAAGSDGYQGLFYGTNSANIYFSGQLTNGSASLSQTLNNLGLEVAEVSVVQNNQQFIGEFEIEVVPPAQRLYFLAPSQVNQGVPFTVTVSGLQDPSVETGVGPDPINVTSGDPAAVLPTGVTLTDGVLGTNDGPGGQGLWTGETHFSVTLNTPGRQTLSFVDAANPSASNGTTIVVAGFAPPTIVAQSAPSQTVSPGATATFWVAAQGAPPLTYQWSFNGAPISGATNSVLTIPSVTTAAAGQYTVTAANAYGTVAGTASTLALGAAGGAPDVDQQPSGQTVNYNSTTVLSVDASTGSPTTSVTSGAKPSTRATTANTYQWFLNGVAISGATSSTYVISNASPNEAGSYFCLITNSSGSVSSNAVRVSVVGSPYPGRLTNLSCRSTVGSGANIMIAGFVVGGQGSALNQSVLLRASGPALTQFNVPGVLPDPTLALHTAAGVRASNSGWGGNTAISAAATGLGAFTWTSSTSKDSALLESLAPGSYTAEIGAASSDTGVALAEVYDAGSSQDSNPSRPHLVNISARTQVGTGGNILIAGFVVGGATSNTVLIRASGPALTAFGVPGVLADPQLKLFRQNSDGSSTMLQSNNGWGNNAEIASVAASVGAFAWAASDGAESAILVTLPPGAYTAQVSGASGDTGIALVEVYDVP
jgi:hypothetical protein